MPTNTSTPSWACMELIHGLDQLAESHCSRTEIFAPLPGGPHGSPLRIRGTGVAPSIRLALNTRGYRFSVNYVLFTHWQGFLLHGRCAIARIQHRPEQHRTYCCRSGCSPTRLSPYRLLDVSAGVGKGQRVLHHAECGGELGGWQATNHRSPELLQGRRRQAANLSRTLPLQRQVVYSLAMAVLSTITSGIAIRARCRSAAGIPGRPRHVLPPRSGEKLDLVGSGRVWFVIGPGYRIKPLGLSGSVGWRHSSRARLRERIRCDCMPKQMPRVAGDLLFSLGHCCDLTFRRRPEPPGTGYRSCAPAGLVPCCSMSF